MIRKELANLTFNTGELPAQKLSLEPVLKSALRDLFDT